MVINVHIGGPRNTSPRLRARNRGFGAKNLVCGSDIMAGLQAAESGLGQTFTHESNQYVCPQRGEEGSENACYDSIGGL